MKEGRLITKSLLISLAGELAYKRGEKYFLEGRVEELLEFGLGYRAIVSGTTNYRVKIEYTLKQFNGSCSCPASEYFDFCKHCVAVALHIAELQTTNFDTIPKKLTPTQKELQKIELFLRQQSAASLTETLMGYISNDRVERNRWLMTISLAGEFDPKGIKKLITKATRGRHIWEYHKVRDFFEPIEELSFHLLKLVMSEENSNQTIILVDYMLERIDLACEKVDDSGGFRFGAVELLNEAYSMTLSKLKLKDEALAEYIFGRLIGWLDIDHYSIEFFNDLLSERVVALISDLAHIKQAKTPKVGMDGDFEDRDWDAIHAYETITRVVKELKDYRDGKAPSL